MASPGLGGVAATPKLVIVSDRELNDTVDAWKCFAAADGKALWSARAPAAGNLDYGNSPRATPVIAGGRAYLFGAFGHLLCANLDSGEVEWDVSLKDEFDTPADSKWGFCSTPLVIDGRIIVNPGTKDASLAALDAKTGKVIWKCPGKPAGYGSLIAMPVRGKTQIIGHDVVSLGGWDPIKGQRLWSILPEKPGDFNVPTPIPLGDKLLVATENNGTRLYEFDDKGKLKPAPVAQNRKLAPDTHTPVVSAGRVFGVWRRLFCLDLAKGLKELWSADESAFAKYGTLVADESRVLFISMSGELILLDANAVDYSPLAKLKLFDDETGLYSHPGFVQNRMYVRGSKSLIAVQL